MSPAGRRMMKAAAILSGAVAVLAAVLPFIDAGRFRPGLKASLEASLQRHVELGALHYRLLPVPGFSAENVIIGEDPAFGLDAMAYVDSLAVDAHIPSLLTGRMYFDTVRLADTSINLARNASGQWALGRLLGRLTSGGDAPRKLVVSHGRINFRTGTQKSPYYLNAVELELTVGRGSRGVEWRYEASPARTDRADQGFGRFSGSGRWEGDSVDVELSLERSATSEVSMLLAGRDLGLQGRVLSQARLFGPLSNIRVAGSLQFEGLERSGLLSFRSPRVSVPYEGTVDLPGQKISLASRPAKEQELPFMAEFRGSGFLTNLSRETTFRFDRMPARTLVEVARRLGQAIPEGLTVEGTITGSLTAGDSGVSGDFEVRDSALTLGTEETLQAEAVALTVRNDEIRLAPARVASGDSVSEVSGLWRTSDGALQFQAVVLDLPVARLQGAARRLAGARAIALLDSVTAGRLSGKLQYDSTSAEEPWSGSFDLSEARVMVAGLSDSVEITRASLRLRGEQWSLKGIQAHAGNVAFGGQLSHTASLRRPVRFELTARDVQAAELEDLFRPTLVRDRGLFDRALRRERSVPPWLRSRHAEGRIRIDRLLAGAHTVRNVAALLFWDGTAIDAPEVSAVWNQGIFRGHWRIALSGGVPEYWLKGQAEGVQCQRGLADLDFEARASGLGTAVVASATLTGDFRARNLEAEGETLRAVSGTLELLSDRSNPRGRLKSIEVQSGAEVLLGSGTIDAGGRVTAEAGGAARTAHWTLELSQRR